MNVAIITGRLTKDVELKATTSGTSVVSFTVAVNRDYKKDGESIADFLDVVAYGHIAEFIAKYFSKGQKIEIQGKMQTRIYEKDGIKRKITEIVADKADFGESKRVGAAPEQEADIDNFMPIDDMDLPF